MYYRDAKSLIVINELKTYEFVGNEVVLNNNFKITAFEGAKEYQMGGYKPADKWLKDRKGKPLTESDILTYKKVISALLDTAKIMDEIENIINF